MSRARAWLSAIAFVAPALWVTSAAVEPTSTIDTNSPPESNIARFGRIAVVDRANPSASIDASSLATEKSTPLAIVPENALLIEWDHPRAIRAIRLEFDGPAPEPGEVNVEWWRRIWPDNGSGGWMKLDDPFNGEWTRARSTANRLDSILRFQFAPLSTNEAPGITKSGAPFRLTYKLRITSPQTLLVRHVDAHSDAEAKRARLRFEWGVKTTVGGDWSPKFDVRNGRIIETKGAGRNARVVEVEYADAPDRLSADRGHVVFRSGETRSFSVFVDDVLREGGVFVRDVGVFVSDATRNLTHATWNGPSGEVWKEGTVAEHVAKLPEQSFEQVGRAIPDKPPNYILLGVPDCRQEIALSPNGDIQLRADSLRSPGPDAEMRPWKWEMLVYQFGSGERPVMGSQPNRHVARSLEEGWLPVVRHEWQSDGIAFTQISVATLLRGGSKQAKADAAADQKGQPARDAFSLSRDAAGTDPVALVNRFEFRNTSTNARTAWLWLELNQSAPMRLTVDGTLLLDSASDREPREGLLPVRGRFNTFGKGSLDMAALVPAAAGSLNPRLTNSADAREAVRYRVDLAPGQSHAIDFVVPYIEVLNRDEMAALRSMNYAASHAATVEFWNDRANRGMTYEVPEKVLNDFWKANLWHVLISSDLDPQTGQLQHGAATHHYKNFLNETMMVARSLEMRGEHDEARRLIETFLANQSVKGLPGHFQNKEGVLYAAHPTEPDPYTAQGYNMHHGWGMWGAAEHFLWTRDDAYIRAHASKLVRAADWVTRERHATKRLRVDGSRPVEFGLAPAGDLEDVEEYLYWYATDAYFYLGMKKVAEALAATGHPEAARINADAEDFAKQIRASVAESVATSPVVRLRDGTHVPFVPPRVYALTHQKEGWIREALYCALHLHDAGIYGERHPFVQWIVQDLEDNIFLSKESGYGIENAKTNFFHLGGITLQPNLLDLALVYLKRDEIPNFLRAFYNTAEASLYPDVNCFAEWVPSFGRGGGPLFKTPDECKFIQWMRQMLVLERGEELELGLGVPRAWMEQGKRMKIQRAATFFGAIDLEIVSSAADGRIAATVRLAPKPGQPSPKAIRLRLRDPNGKPIKAALVNGKRADVIAARQMIELPVSGEAWNVQATF